MIVAKKKVFGNAKTGKTEEISENYKNGKNGDKDENLRKNFVQVLYI